MKNLKILAICQYGWPEPSPSLNPMEEMVKRGHTVDAVTGTPNYPMGEIYKGYEHNRVKEEEHNGVRIFRVPVVPRKHDAVHRLLNYHSYPISAKRKVRKLPGDYDVVFANQSSPVMMVEPALLYAKKHDKRVVMYCMDLWPASLCVGGVKKGSPIYRYYHRVSKRIYRGADLILVTSRMFADYLTSEFGVPEERIEYLPQYALSEFDSIPGQGEKETTDFVFAGNVGAAQDLGVLLDAAKALEEEGVTDNGRRLVFHIVGDGQELGSLKARAEEEGIRSVVFHGRKPTEEMPAYYSLADAMLVTLAPDPVVSLTLPAKMQSYMAAGKPIVACADGEIANVINESGCGFCAKGHSAEELKDKLKAFLACGNRRELGEKARAYYLAHFSKELVMDKLERILLANSK